MKFFTLPLLTLVGRACAHLTKFDMIIHERPTTTISVFPEKHTCRIPEPSRSSADRLQDLVPQEELKGPCIFEMKRIHKGNVTDYLSKTGQTLDGPKVDFVNFRVGVHAPSDLQTYISTIFFEKQDPGTNCSSSRLSRWPTDEGKIDDTNDKAEAEEARYFRQLVSIDDETPSWAIQSQHQLSEGDYLLEIPRSCLSETTELVIETVYVYEDAALQAQIVKRRGRLVNLSEDCSVAESRMQIETQDKYIELIDTLPRKCGYGFERDYEWLVPETHILVEAGTTTVVAQIALNEPLLPDHERNVTRLALGRVTGANCTGTAVYARRKGRDVEEDTRVENVTLRGNSVYVEAPWEFSEPVYNFRFVLPPGCKIEETTATARVVDSKRADKSSGVKNNQNENTTTRRPQYSSTNGADESGGVENNQDEDITTRRPQYSSTAPLTLADLDMSDGSSQVKVVSLYPEKFTCLIPDFIKSLDRSEDLVLRKELKGPCIFFMNRLHEGNVTDYLLRTGQTLYGPESDFVTFLFGLHAPTDIQTDIKRIAFEPLRSRGTNCSSARLSRWPTDDGKPLGSKDKAALAQPRYFPQLPSSWDDTPFWSAERNYQRPSGENYLLEVPRSCLSAPTKLIIGRRFSYEDAALQAQIVKGRGRLVNLSEDCSVAESRMQIETQDEYIELIDTLPRKCGYGFERDYAWVVPETHIFVEAGTTTVVAPIALIEPLLPDHERHVTKLSLGRLTGVNCADTASYAARKASYWTPGDRVENVTLSDNSVYVDPSWEFSAPQYSFRFVLPPGCIIEKATVTFRVVDSKRADESIGVEDNQNEETTTRGPQSSSTKGADESSGVQKNQNEDTTTRRHQYPSTKGADEASGVQKNPNEDTTVRRRQYSSTKGGDESIGVQEDQNEDTTARRHQYLSTTHPSTNSHHNDASRLPIGH